MKQICEAGQPIAFEQWPVDLRVRQFPIMKRVEIDARAEIDQIVAAMILAGVTAVPK